MKCGPRRTEAEVAAARLARVKRKPKALQCLTYKVSNSSNSIYISTKVLMRSNCSAGPRLYVCTPSPRDRSVPPDKKQNQCRKTQATVHYACKYMMVT